MNAPSRLAFALTLTLLAAGCHRSPANPSAADAAASRADAHALLESEREQMAQVPPPSKSRFLAIRSLESWENPYLTLQSGMVELHVTMADANPTTMGVGGMLRPIGARRQELNIGLDRLGEAITAVPASAWPYGRVVAIEEAHNLPASARPAIRRNLEATLALLNTLGVEVYDPTDGKLQ